jgi:hypothetical protein
MFASEVVRSALHSNAWWSDRRSRGRNILLTKALMMVSLSAAKTGICGWSTPGSDAAKVVLLGEVLKLRWRGPTPAVTCNVR